MPEIVMYISPFCPYCRWAKSLLDGKGVDYTVLNVDRQPGLWREMEQRSGRSTVPQIFIGQTHVGGYDELSALDRRGGLDPLLKGD